MISNRINIRYMSVQIILMQINITLNEANRKMNTKYLVVVAAVAAMLIAAIALATDSAFADKMRKSSEKNQATAQVNDCGNDFEPFNVFCQNLASQIQGDDNSAALSGEQSSETGG
jgi:flagellar basal body-associated protein FliL